MLLSGLPCHYYKKAFLTPLLKLVGKFLYLDTTYIKRTWAGMPKVKMQIDLSKPRPRHVWIGLHNEDNTIDIWKPVEYENIPTYSEYCRHQGYYVEEYKSWMRDEE